MMRTCKACDGLGHLNYGPHHDAKGCFACGGGGLTAHALGHLYLAHPLGAGPDRDANIARATRWYAWLSDLGFMVHAPWILLAAVWTEERREQGLEIDRVFLDFLGAVNVEMSDCGFALTGGRVSPGMDEERDWAREYGLFVHDLTFLGPEPPEAR